MAQVNHGVSNGFHAVMVSAVMLQAFKLVFPGKDTLNCTKSLFGVSMPCLKPTGSTASNNRCCGVICSIIIP
ncbi:hypothetical protein [Legionella massiliensis]|uniref:hypothetical protein n=1 Tax=Legionella massiliensis TaxID=1034943 RepID=UPI0005C3BD31|nr:hypothetical protein [Legionella massiliensis]